MWLLWCYKYTRHKNASKWTHTGKGCQEKAYGDHKNYLAGGWLTDESIYLIISSSYLLPRQSVDHEKRNRY